jgi:uncharacterized membrane-anchored protein
LKVKVYILLFSVALVVGIFLSETYQKEQVLKDGELVLLKLVPLDPRSLMQGDYMALRYAVTRELNPDSIPARGYCILRLDENGVGHNSAIRKNKGDLKEGEIAIRYYYNERFVSIGAESYFFEEGSASKFDSAKYGGLRVSKNGSSVLVGLYNEGLKLIE